MSVLVAKNATRSSKSRLNRERARANGTPSTRTSCSEHLSRRSPARTKTCQRPKSRCRHVEATARVSYRAQVLNEHIGQTRRRRRRATSTMTEAVPVKETSSTEMPSRANRRLNAVVTRTDGPSFGRRENRQT